MDSLELLLGEVGHRIGRMHIDTDSVVADDPVVEASLFFLERREREIPASCASPRRIISRPLLEPGTSMLPNGMPVFAVNALAASGIRPSPMVVEPTYVIWAEAKPESIPRMRAKAEAVLLITVESPQLAGFLPATLGQSTPHLDGSQHSRVLKAAADGKGRIRARQLFLACERAPGKGSKVPADL